jgi:hypothetical protein
MRTARHCLTPLAAVAGGLLDAVHYLEYRRAGGTDSPLRWEFAPVETWDKAPGQVARRDHSAHLAYGAGTGATFWLLARIL